MQTGAHIFRSIHTRADGTLAGLAPRRLDWSQQSHRDPVSTQVPSAGFTPPPGPQQARTSALEADAVPEN